ncbi:MAG: hypothetical protein QOF22_1600, partial [Bradyrhizobium sp.]|nr:hypothetical protein [Bradyrhizobium sp.]
QILRHNKCIVIVISHRPSALAQLNMAMVLYEGKSIAFGPCEEIFARVRAQAEQAGATRQAAAFPKAKTARRAPVAEGVEP